MSGVGLISMVIDKRSLWFGGFAALLLCGAAAVHAQDAADNGIIGPPQLKDFRLPQGERTGPLVIPPASAPAQRPVELAPPPPPAAEPAPARGQPTAARPPEPQSARPAPAAAPDDANTSTAEAAPEVETPASPGPASVADVPVAPVDTAPAPAPADPAGEASTAAAPSSSGSGFGYLYYALPAALLALLGAVLMRRRRRGADEQPASVATPAAAAPPKPRPDPMPRPWLELSLKAERASFTPTEAIVLFELEIANKGKAPARNLRIDVKMFNAGAEQDKEIGSFFKTAGRETTKLKLPAVEAGVTGVIQGSVRMAVEDIRAMRLDEKLLFIPVVAVNALYDWGENRTGQTSRSYIVGRELQEASEKMGAFRVDQGPRVWRTVGQREHKLTKRV